MLSIIKTILQITDNDMDSMLLSLIELCKNPILLEINETTVPPQLEWILIELVVARYNRLSHEGYSSESIEGGSISFKDNLLTEYQVYFKKYLENKSKNSIGIEFI